MVALSPRRSPIRRGAGRLRALARRAPGGAATSAQVEHARASAIEATATVHTALHTLALRQQAADDRKLAAESATAEALAYLTGELRRVTDLLERLPPPELVSQLPQDIAATINFAISSDGYAAQRDLWINQPVVLEHAEGDVRVTAINERIAEPAFALRALRHVGDGARLVDVGASESTLALSLAVLGYRVTALDPRGYPFAHPSLEAVTGELANWHPGEPLDGAIAISTVEHIGLGFYGEPRHEDGDLAALGHLRELVRPRGLLVLTVPFGARAAVSEFERTYDTARLERLLAGWEVLERLFLERSGELEWRASEQPPDDGVAMVAARRPES
jgi:hypothetical protein